MEFENLNLWTLLIFLIIFWGIIFLTYKKYNIQIQFNKRFKLLSSWKYFYIKYIFLLLSLFIVTFAIFWVQYWEKTVNNESKWVDLMFVLDVSKSMNVADITDDNYAYTRLDIAKESIANFITKHPADRGWLIIFAWDAISTIPLTTDHNLFLTFLKWVDYRNLVKQWSDFEKALSLWVDRFLEDDDDRSKALIFISDWWDREDYINSKLIKQIKNQKKGISYFVVWIWTSKWWRIIKWVDAFNRYIYQKYNWDYVISKINRSNLKDIASVLDWDYIEVKKVWDLDKLNKAINSLVKKVIKTGNSSEKWDFGRGLIIISFILFIIYLILYIFEETLIFNYKKYAK